MQREYEAAVEEAYQRAVDKYCALLYTEFDSVPHTQAGLTVWRERVEIIWDAGKASVSGWTCKDQHVDLLSTIQTHANELEREIRNAGVRETDRREEERKKIEELRIENDRKREEEERVRIENERKRLEDSAKLAAQKAAANLDAANAAAANQAAVADAAAANQATAADLLNTAASDRAIANVVAAAATAGANRAIAAVNQAAENLRNMNIHDPGYQAAANLHSIAARDRTAADQMAAAATASANLYLVAENQAATNLEDMSRDAERQAAAATTAATAAAAANQAAAAVVSANQAIEITQVKLF